jgi:hypothetical protein
MVAISIVCVGVDKHPVCEVVREQRPHVHGRLSMGIRTNMGLDSLLGMKTTPLSDVD